MEDFKTLASRHIFIYLSMPWDVTEKRDVVKNHTFFHIYCEFTDKGWSKDKLPFAKF